MFASSRQTSSSILILLEFLKFFYANEFDVNTWRHFRNTSRTFHGVLRNERRQIKRVTSFTPVDRERTSFTPNQQLSQISPRSATMRHTCESCLIFVEDMFSFLSSSHIDRIPFVYISN